MCILLTAATGSPARLTDAQMRWLRQDLRLADRRKKVVLCYHIPLTFGNRPKSGATAVDIATEQGHYESSRLAQILKLLKRFKGGYEPVLRTHAFCDKP